MGSFMSPKPSYCHRRPAAEKTALPPGRGPGKSSGQGRRTPQPAWGRAPPGARLGLGSFPLPHSLISQIPPRMPRFAIWVAASGWSGLWALSRGLLVFVWGVWGFLARQAKVADGNGAVGQYPVAVPPASSYAAGGQLTGQGGVGGLCPVAPPRPSPSLFSTRGHAEAPVAIEATARSSGAELAGDAETATPLSLHKRGR